MPSKWQQWMPFRIDAFKGSPAVQAMHPCARIGYLYLLSRAWQTEDCTVSNDQLELAEASGLGDELWAIHGPRILRKFEPVEGGRLRNEVCFCEWSEAKRVYEKRADAAHRTNTARSPQGNATVTVEESNGHRAPTVYGPVYVPVDVNVPVNGENGSELMAANWLLEELGVVADNGVRKVAAEAIRLLAREGGDVKTATEFIHLAGRNAVAAGEVINRFWFTDQKYRPAVPTKSRKAAAREAHNKAFLEASSDD